MTAAGRRLGSVLAVLAAASCASGPPSRELAERPAAPLALLPPTNLSASAGESRAFFDEFRAAAERAGEPLVAEDTVENALRDIGIRYTSEMRPEDAAALADKVGTDRLLASTILYASGDPLPQYAVELRLIDGEIGEATWEWMGGLSAEQIRKYFGPPVTADLPVVRRSLAGEAVESLVLGRPPADTRGPSGIRAWRDAFFLLRPGDRIAVLPFEEPNGEFRGPGNAIARALSTAIAESTPFRVVPYHSLLSAFEELGARSPLELDEPRLKEFAVRTGAVCVVTGSLTVAREGSRGPSDEPVLSLNARALDTNEGRYVWACALERRGGISPGLLARDRERSLAELFVSSSRVMARSLAAPDIE